MHYESHSNLAEALNNTLPRLLYIILVCCVQSDAVILTLYRAVFCVGGGGGGRWGGDSARVDFVLMADPRWSPFVHVITCMTSSLRVANLKGNTFGSTV